MQNIKTPIYIHLNIRAHSQIYIYQDILVFYFLYFIGIFVTLSW